VQLSSIESLYVTFTGHNLTKLQVVDNSLEESIQESKVNSAVRVLWLNWRDLKNPEAGGAEVFTHEVMRGLAQKGHHITLFTSHFPNAPLNEKMDDINIVRGGSNNYGVYQKARDYYKKHKDEYDIVIDEINVKPFLTPRFVKDGKPVIALIHQLSRELFLTELPFPLNYIGYHLENRWLSCYRDITTLTVSDSTRKDLEYLGLRKVSIVPEGLSCTPLNRVPEKDTTPTIVFLGRLKRHKRPDHAIRAFSLIKKRIPNARLWIIGDGYMREELERKCNIGGVTFYGRVSSEFKYRLLSKAHIVLVPSTREGWGLVVTESNAMGTPVVAYNVPGLRDSVIHEKTGILAENCSPEALAQSAISLFEDKDHLCELSCNALDLSRQYSWDKTVEVFEKTIMQKIPISISTNT
jgi:glycosyltransferase involved in cell wall biosynthesis